MTIDEAIEILEELPGNVNNVLDHDQQLALKLGVKALERFRNLRDAGKDVGMPLLKGEKRR